MPWLVDLTTLATDAGMTLGVDFFTSTKAAIPILASGEATLAVVETSGSAPERTQNSVIRPAYLRVAAQVMARANSPEAARAKAQDYYNAIVGIRNSWITNGLQSGWYREITPLQEPFDAGVDDRKQARYGFNIIGIKRP